MSHRIKYTPAVVFNMADSSYEDMAWIQCKVLWKFRKNIVDSKIVVKTREYFDDKIGEEKQVYFKYVMFLVRNSETRYWLPEYFYDVAKQNNSFKFLMRNCGFDTEKNYRRHRNGIIQ